MRTFRRKLFPATFTLALALPGAAFAQYGMPTPAPPQQSMANPGQNGSQSAPAPTSPPELLAAATCLVARNQAAADPLFATAPFSSQERQAAVRLIGDMQRCGHRAPISTSAALVRSALAEATLEARFPSPQAAHDPAVDAAPLFRQDQATALPSAADLAPGYALAECTARQHPELIRTLLATEPASAEAGAAFTAINPAFVACVTPGTRLNVDGRMIRGMLAEALYRWSVVQRDGQASAWAAAAPPPAPTAATAAPSAAPASGH